MTCPKCGNEQSDGWLSCQKCHIIFSRWNAAAAPAPARPAAAPAAGPAPEPPRPVTLFGDRPAEPLPPSGPVLAAGPKTASAWVYLALLLPFAAALWWLLNPRGRPVAPGSYQDSDKQFALRAPDGWLELTRANYEAIIRQYGPQLPAQFAQAPGSPGLAVSFVRLGPPGEFPPSLNVVVVQQAPPAINEKSMREAAKAIADSFNALLADYRQENVRIITVDKVRALEIVSTAASPIRLPGEAGRPPSHLRYRQVLVPGKKRTFILTFTDRADAAGGSAGDYQRALESFRVLKRPPRFGPVLHGGLVGGLVAGLLSLLGGLLRALGGRRD